MPQTVVGWGSKAGTTNTYPKIVCALELKYYLLASTINQALMNSEKTDCQQFRAVSEIYVMRNGSGKF